jgi:hypothetical protein
LIPFPKKIPLANEGGGINLTPFSPANPYVLDGPHASTGGGAHPTEGLANPSGERCAAALLRISTNRSLAGRCAANFRGLLVLQDALLSNKKIPADAIFLSTQ